MKSTPNPSWRDVRICVSAVLAWTVSRSLWTGIDSPYPPQLQRVNQSNPPKILEEWAFSKKENASPPWHNTSLFRDNHSSTTPFLFGHTARQFLDDNRPIWVIPDGEKKCSARPLPVVESLRNESAFETTNERTENLQCTNTTWIKDDRKAGENNQTRVRRARFCLQTQAIPQISWTRKWPCPRMGEMTLSCCETS